MILRNLHWSHARFAMEPGVLLRVRIAPVGFAPAGDPELVESMARPIHQLGQMGIQFVFSSGEVEDRELDVGEGESRSKLRIVGPPKLNTFPRLIPRTDLFLSCSPNGA